MAREKQGRLPCLMVQSVSQRQDLTNRFRQLSQHIAQPRKGFFLFRSFQRQRLVSQHSAPYPSSVSAATAPISQDASRLVIPPRVIYSPDGAHGSGSSRLLQTAFNFSGPSCRIIIIMIKIVMSVFAILTEAPMRKVEREK